MKKHVYIIDDDEDDVDLIIEALNKINYPCNCTWAKSGAQALKQLQYIRPDVIFIDFNMQEMNGIECLKAIRGLPNCDHVPVIFHSTCITEDLCKQALEAGAYKCLRKPNSLNQQINLLQQCELT